MITRQGVIAAEKLQRRVTFAMFIFTKAMLTGRETNGISEEKVSPKIPKYFFYFSEW